MTSSNSIDNQAMRSFDAARSDDIRCFHCPDTKWKLQPTIKLLTAYGNEVEPFGADYILQKLGFRHARLTIPKWLQRGIMDPCEQSMTFVQLFLYFFCLNVLKKCVCESDNLHKTTKDIILNHAYQCISFSLMFSSRSPQIPCSRNRILICSRCLFSFSVPVHTNKLFLYFFFI